MTGAALTALTAGLVACRQASPTEESEVAGYAMEVRHVDAAGAAEVIEEAGTVVLDVRTPSEYSSGHVPGAINIDFNEADFESRLDTLDREPMYVVYCRSGYRSSRALKVLGRLRFRLVVHLAGGMTAWEKAGEPVER
jgi:rhodanese-related sulfurtransferase